jgi:competence protein ComEC
VPTWIISLLIAIMGCLRIYYQLDNILEKNLINNAVTTTGYIANIPEIKNNNTTFEFIIDKTQNFQQSIHARLSWRNAPALKVGDTWQLTVHLKKPRGFWDENSFDYQKWLFEQRISATGYVVDNNSNHLLASTNYSHLLVDRIRQQLSSSLSIHLQAYPLNGLIAALAVGVRNNINETQWSVLRGTGTNHLFAIAGLHIGFAAGIIYALVNFCWRRFRSLPLYLATPQAAALGSLLMAILYAALAGFALPTQRAIIMILVFLAATLWRRHLPPWRAWIVALLIVLIINPLDVLSASFCLSFGAVALIIYSMSGRIKKQKWWQHWARMQWVIAIGLIPLSLLFFQQASLASFIANAIAIPWVGFTTLPLCLLGDIAWFISPTLSTWVWIGAEYSLQIVWPVLTFISALNGVQWISYITNYWVLISSLIAVALFLAPKKFPARCLSILWALPLLFYTPPTPNINECWLTVLDVGKGTAAIIQTAHHLLIYNSGPRFSNTFDAADAVIIPFLQAHNINNVDLLFLSDNKNTHTGGTATLLQQIPVQHVITPAPFMFKTGFATPCISGENWQWDGIKFTVLDKCRLRIDNNTQSILLPDDISNSNQGEIMLKLTGRNEIIKTNIYKKHFWN